MAEPILLGVARPPRPTRTNVRYHTAGIYAAGLNDLQVNSVNKENDSRTSLNQLTHSSLDDVDNHAVPVSGVGSTHLAHKLGRPN